MSGELSYLHLKVTSQAREAEEKRTEARRKNILLLILAHLRDQGYHESMKILESETNFSLSKFEVCDNIDLDTILQEFESYYFVKFHKYPKLTKRVLLSSDNEEKKPAATTKIKSRSASNFPGVLLGDQKKKRSSPASSSGSEAEYSKQTSSNDSNMHPENLGLCGTAIGKTPDSCQTNKAHQLIDYKALINDATRLPHDDLYASERLLKPLGGFSGYSEEWKELALVISKEIYLHNPNVKWDDIIGLEEAKRLIKEAVVYPIKYPQLFCGLLSPWKGLLLYGPSGTGKTLLAKAVATECKTTFFNISASTIVSKWRGDSEKLVRILFELARFHAPSTIFLDELESIMSQRGSFSGSQHEGSLRMKTELLIQMDGLSRSNDLVFLLAASNLPWELDHAMLRRLEKRILVDLPSMAARSAMFQHYLPPKIKNENKKLGINTNIDYNSLAELSEGYSGSDIQLVCKEAAMRPVRKVFDILENHQKDTELPFIQLDPVITTDVQDALQRTKPSARIFSKKYKEWQKEYESV